MIHYTPYIPLFPFIAFVINILFGRYVRKGAALISIAASLAACAVALPAIAYVVHHGAYSVQTEWLLLGKKTLSFGVLLDPLGCVLLFVVTLIGTLIQVYSAGYMHDDAHFSRFFAYVSLFMAAMLTLVIANNYLLFFMAWEVMGLCSYLLIGFWSEKNSAADAGRKAFLTTRVGDIGFFIGIMTLFAGAGTLNFADLGHAAHLMENTPLLTAAALLIFCGTVGKSAQFPLHVWLPDAMEGPTPVSALIHAATMVAAGVFLIARSFPLFEAAPDAMQTVAVIGTMTAFMAAFIALSATDIKKVLAYSTISQLGYMVAALGLGGFAAGTFHLMTHAFFKALLFLGAGSVIHGCHTQDLREMGGLFGKMKHTAATFVLASLAIAGVPPLSGFWSKDEILAAAYTAHNPVIYWTLALTALMTSFYMFRLVFMAFFGKPRNPKIHAHESPAVMTVPLWLLAIGAVLAGIPGSPFMHHWFQNFLAGGVHAGGHAAGHGSEHVIIPFVVATSLAAAFGGIISAWFLYLKNPGLPAIISRVFRPLYTASLNKLWFDEIYTILFIRPFGAMSRALYRIDEQVIDYLVNKTGLATARTSRIKGWIDKHIVDGLVNLTGWTVQLASALVRLLQTGYLQHYVLIAFLGTIVLFFIELRK
ncbi:MAG: NADH-quinone oxidoreductase subunit L [Omnitrophica bacterium GWA2_52_8]|nr:MAG: NADH-quinone oxidoreductase subunit L [Omnitrophica bacterium GWA2_52_8]